MLENTLQEAGQFITLAGVLGGFAFAAVIELLVSEKKGKLATAVIALFSTSALMFLYSLVVYVLIYSALLETGEVTTELGRFAASTTWFIFGAIFLLLISIAVAGWIHARTTGIITTVVAGIFACLMLVAAARVIMLVPPLP